jgi:hypothetical protein
MYRVMPRGWRLRQPRGSRLRGVRALRRARMRRTAMLPPLRLSLGCALTARPFRPRWA